MNLLMATDKPVPSKADLFTGRGPLAKADLSGGDICLYDSGPRNT